MTTRLPRCLDRTHAPFGDTAISDLVTPEGREEVPHRRELGETDWRDRIELA